MRIPTFHALLPRLLAAHGGKQIFVFGSQGEPFWVARVPLEREELDVFNRCLDLIETLDASRPKPYFAYDPERAFLVAALPEASDLYFVVLLDPATTPFGPEDPAAAPRPSHSAEARLAQDWIEELERHLGTHRAAVGVTDPS